MYENVSYCGAGKFVSSGQWIHPARSIDTYEIMFVLSGTVYIDEDGIPYQLKENDLLLLEPMRHHFGYRTSSNTSFFWIHFTCDQKPDPACKHRNISEPYNLLLLFKQILHYGTENQAGECLDYLTRVLLFEVFSLHRQESTSRLAAEIAAWITANRDMRLSAEQISARFGYNADYISRLFKTHYGKSLKEYINEVRIRHIKQQLLTKEQTLAEIAYHAGFTDYKYFLKFFKYHEGITPTQFLKSYPKTHVNKK